MACPAVRPIFQSKPICPRHPGLLREVIKRLAACQLHGESHPSRGSHATAPIACDGSRPKRWPLQRSDVRLDGSIIVPAAGHGRTGSHPVLTACCFSLLAGKNKPKTCIFFFGGVSLFSSGRSPRSSRLGFGFRQSSGNVPDEWVCSFQSSGRDKKDLSLYLPLSERSNNPIYSKKFFSFLSIRFFRLWTAC